MDVGVVGRGGDLCEVGPWVDASFDRPGPDAGEPDDGITPVAKSASQGNDGERGPQKGNGIRLFAETFEEDVQRFSNQRVVPDRSSQGRPVGIVSRQVAID